MRQNVTLQNAYVSRNQPANKVTTVAEDLWKGLHKRMRINRAQIKPLAASRRERAATGDPRRTL
jgi:hypothetical protein